MSVGDGPACRIQLRLAAPVARLVVVVVVVVVVRYVAVRSAWGQ
jgi:hypothetical protein